MLQAPDPSLHLECDKLPLPFNGEGTIDEDNTRRYNYAITGNEYNAIVIDLDGVLVSQGCIEKESFKALMDKTILNPEGRVPLSIASGRTIEEIKHIVLPEIQSIILEKGADLLNEGELIVFASNAAIGIDAATSDILYDSPIDQAELEKAHLLEEVQTIRDITMRQSALLDATGQKLVNRAKIINDSYTYSLGLNPRKLDLVAETGQDGVAAVEKFLRLYGDLEDLLGVVERLNAVFEERNIALVATTSGALIDINSRGVSKDWAIQVTRQVLAQKEGLSLGDIKPDTILSLGDSPLGNDKPITQRAGGFTNVGGSLEGSVYPIAINEVGDQYAKVAKFLSKVRLSPVKTETMPCHTLDSDYLVPSNELQAEMPGGRIIDTFDVTGAQRITIQKARSIMEDPALPESVRQFFASHASVGMRGERSVVFLRGRPYYEVLSSLDNTQTLYEEVIKISDLVKSFDSLEEEVLSNTQRDALLCILDHGKAYVLRLLNSEIEHGFTQDNDDVIAAYFACAESFIDRYYKTLLYKHRKNDTAHPLNLPSPHTHRQEHLCFSDLMREMDQPLPIAMQANYIAEEMRKRGVRYDQIVTPLFGAAELGFALRSMLDMKGFDYLPSVLPVRFSGKKAREGEQQHDIFPLQMQPDLTGTNLLIFDDNSGTGATIRQLKNELERYGPAVVHAAVVQVGTTTRIQRVLNREKRNYYRAVLMPEDIAFKGIQVYNLKESLRAAEQFLNNISLADYLKGP